MSRNRSHRDTNANQIASHPQDHKQSDDTVRRVSARGIDIGIDPKVLDDWEFMESLYDLQADPKGNALQVIPFIRRLLGDSYDRVKNGLRGADGRIDGETMGAFLTELFEEMGKAFPNS